ncbi:hypothetical protein GCM10029992_61360 [Glycomyces albus]
MRKRLLSVLATAIIAPLAIVVSTEEASAESGEAAPASADVLVAGEGDSNGFHLLVADAARPEQWSELAVLEEPGFETDRWIGQHCVTDSQRQAVVVYAPREYSNAAAGMYAGAFAAVVDLETGAVEKLGERTSLAYYNPRAAPTAPSFPHWSATTPRSPPPGCSSSTPMRPPRTPSTSSRSPASSPRRSSTATASPPRRATCWSASTPTARPPLSRHGSVPFDLHTDADGGIGFQTVDGDESVVHRYHDGDLTEVARSDQGRMALDRDAEGRIVLKGVHDSINVDTSALPDAWESLDVPIAAELSTGGGAAVLDSRMSGNAPSDDGTESSTTAETMEILAYSLDREQTHQAAAPVGEVPRTRSRRRR